MRKSDGSSKLKASVILRQWSKRVFRYCVKRAEPQLNDFEQRIITTRERWLM